MFCPLSEILNVLLFAAGVRRGTGMADASGVARRCSGVGRTKRHLLGAANERELSLEIHVI